MNGVRFPSRLHLAGTAQAPPPRVQAPSMQPLQATDPRWVLAVRTQEQLQGAILSPDRRDKLLRLGRTLGLGPFEANLIIAIVQDQARRGLSIAQAHQTLQFVPLRTRHAGRKRWGWRIGMTALAVVLLEWLAVVLWW